MRRLAVIVPLLAVLAIAGCSGEAAPEPEPTTAELGKVTTIDALVDAYTAAGGVCNWDQTDVITVAAASGECRTANAATCDAATDWSVLSMYATEAARDEIVGNITGGACFKSLLVGPNWVINASDVDDVADSLGGEVLKP